MDKQNLEQQVRGQKLEIEKLKKKVRRSWWISVFLLWSK